MATARLDIRLDEPIKAKAEKASALLGHKSLTEYIVKTLSEDASRVIEEYGDITLQNDVFDTFWNACKKADEPNSALRAAAEYSKENGFR